LDCDAGVVRELTDPSDLVEALRVRLTMRLAELSPYRTSSEPEHRTYRARWEYASKVLHHIEELRDLSSLDEARELIEMCVETAQSDGDEDAERAEGRDVPISVRRPGAIASEAELVLQFVERPLVPSLRFARIPSRRVLNHEEYTDLVRRARARWAESDGGFSADGMIDTKVSFLRIEQILAAEGIERVIFLHAEERALSVDVDVQLIPALPEDGAPSYFPPARSYLTTGSLDFFVYCGENRKPRRAAGWLASRLLEF
jgi:hypothetical protein